MKLNLLLGAACAPLLLAGAAFAQDVEDTGPETAVEDVIVTGQPALRNRTDDTVPTLSYDLEYFQRFEPLTVGDALKRVPSVAFLSDVLEYDGVRLRGIDPGYTQILINGERVPGAGLDRSFFVDRIPAELIERVEVVRSSSANRSGDAVAGAVNIILRDALSLNGGYIRAGLLAFDDSEYGVIGKTFGAVWGGEVGEGRLLLGANMQDRRNPKVKFSIRDDATAPGVGLGNVDNVEAQTDVRDGVDYSFNAAYQRPLFGGEFDISAVYVRTDRVQDEDSIEYHAGNIRDADLLTINDNDLSITTDNFSSRARWEVDAFGGELTLKAGYAFLQDEQFETEFESEYLRDAVPFPDEDRFTADAVVTDVYDEEYQFAAEHDLDLSEELELEFGVQANLKTRDSNIRNAQRIRFNVPNAPTPRPGQPPFILFNPAPGGVATIEETRIDPFVLIEDEEGAVRWEAGLRYETTDVTITDFTVAAPLRTTSKDYAELLPSVSLRWRFTETDRLIASAARTVRRPNFNQVSPVTLLEDQGDNDLRGNPNLEPEVATGFDLGWERSLGRRGVVGLNAFYRSIENVIETSSVLVGGAPVQGSGGAGTRVLQWTNTGNGDVYGVEFDLSTPLEMFGLESTGVFLNYSWLDSEVRDAFGERRFNDQSDYVLSTGFTQDLPSVGAAFGATYREQGDALGRVVGEVVTTSYGGDLEVFFEKRLGQKAILRFTGSNLLDSSKDETFRKFDTFNNQAANLIDDEFEIETEESGPVYQVVLRVAF